MGATMSKKALRSSWLRAHLEKMAQRLVAKGWIRGRKPSYSALQTLDESRVSPDTSSDRFFLKDVAKGPYSVPKRLAVGSAFHVSPQMLARHQRADWQHTPVHLRVFAARLCEAARKLGIPLYVHGAFRSAAQQQEMLRRGVSKAQWPRAPHCQGKAVDIVHGRYHWEMSRDEWAFIGRLGKDISDKMGLSLNWGGDWSFYDPAHWEMADWKEDIRSLAASPQPLHATPRAILAQRGVLSENMTTTTERHLRENGFLDS